MKLGSIIFVAVLALVTPEISAAQNRTFESKWFSAEVKNIRHLKSGKTLITVEFRGKLEQNGVVELFGPQGDCRKSATLIDGDGNEFGTNRCMGLVGFGAWDTGQAFEIRGRDFNTFVYEFSTPQVTSGVGGDNMDLIIPVVCKWYIDGNGGGYFEPSRRGSTSVTISFYGMTK